MSWMGMRRYMVRRQSLRQSSIHGHGEAQSCASYGTEEALLSCSFEVRAVESFYELSAHRLRVGHASCVQHGVQVAMQMLL